jgi:hypothetical protein
MYFFGYHDTEEGQRTEREAYARKQMRIQELNLQEETARKNVNMYTKLTLISALAVGAGFFISDNSLTSTFCELGLAGTTMLSASEVLLNADTHLRTGNERSKLQFGDIVA